MGRRMWAQQRVWVVGVGSAAGAAVESAGGVGAWAEARVSLGACVVAEGEVVS